MAKGNLNTGKGIAAIVANENADEDVASSEDCPPEESPKTGNDDLDKVLGESKPGESDKDWQTPGTKEVIEDKIGKIPGAKQSATDVGGTTTVLPDGTRVNVYPGRTSTGKPGWEVYPPGQTKSSVKGSILDE